MPYRYLEEIATADVAFSARERDLAGLCRTAVDATTNIMVADLGTVSPRLTVPVRLTAPAPDLLLFALLNEIVFLKDSRRLLLRAEELCVERTSGEYTLTGNLTGEEIDPGRHPLVVDIKGVTLHLFRVEETGEGWEATVVLDV